MAITPKQKEGLMILSHILRAVHVYREHREPCSIDRLTKDLRGIGYKLNGATVLAYLRPLQDGKIIELKPVGREGVPHIYVTLP